MEFPFPHQSSSSSPPLGRVRASANAPWFAGWGPRGDAGLWEGSGTRRTPWGARTPPGVPRRPASAVLACRAELAGCSRCYRPHIGRADISPNSLRLFHGAPQLRNPSLRRGSRLPGSPDRPQEPWAPPPYLAGGEVAHLATRAPLVPETKDLHGVVEPHTQIKSSATGPPRLQAPRDVNRPRDRRDRWQALGAPPGVPRRPPARRRSRGRRATSPGAPPAPAPAPPGPGLGAAPERAAEAAAAAAERRRGSSGPPRATV